MNNSIKFLVDKKEEGERLDIFLSKKIDYLTRSNIKKIIESSIMLGGSSLRDYVNTQGKMGYFQSTFNVYGRDGKKCISKGCSSRITRIVQSNRSTFFCPSCQKK